MIDTSNALWVLLAKVEAGVLPEAVFHGSSSIRGHWAYITGFDAKQRNKIFLAYNGSLDAAKVLQEAVLPEWAWCCATVGNEVGTMPTSRLRKRVSVDGDGIVSAENNCPARAWLIAVLKALISEAEH